MITKKTQQHPFLSATPTLFVLLKQNGITHYKSPIETNSTKYPSLENFQPNDQEDVDLQNIDQNSKKIEV